MMPPVEMLTKDGYDLQFGTNVLGTFISNNHWFLTESFLGHFYFTKLLLPILESTAQNSPEKHVRVVTTSSSGHLFWGPKIQYNSLRDDPSRKKIGTQMLYSQSKYVSTSYNFKKSQMHGINKNHI